MSDAESARLRATLERLFSESGLDVDDGTLDRVADLHRHYAADRVRLAAAELGETEPATVFSVEAVRPESDHGRD